MKNPSHQEIIDWANSHVDRVNMFRDGLRLRVELSYSSSAVGIEAVGRWRTVVSDSLQGAVKAALANEHEVEEERIADDTAMRQIEQKAEDNRRLERLSPTLTA